MYSPNATAGETSDPTTWLVPQDEICQLTPVVYGVLLPTDFNFNPVADFRVRSHRWVKSMVLFSDSGGAGPLMNDTLRNTLNLRVSKYFRSVNQYHWGFNSIPIIWFVPPPPLTGLSLDSLVLCSFGNLVVEDTISDGLSINSAPQAQLHPNDDPISLLHSEFNVSGPDASTTYDTFLSISLSELFQRIAAEPFLSPNFSSEQNSLLDGYFEGSDPSPALQIRYTVTVEENFVAPPQSYVVQGDTVENSAVRPVFPSHSSMFMNNL